MYVLEPSVRNLPVVIVQQMLSMVWGVSPAGGRAPRILVDR
jgi:hypothetical protein